MDVGGSRLGYIAAIIDCTCRAYILGLQVCISAKLQAAPCINWPVSVSVSVYRESGRE